VDITVQQAMALRLDEVAKLVAKDPLHGMENAAGIRYSYPAANGNTIYRFDAGWVEVGPGESKSKVYATRDVSTPQGIVHVRQVEPETLTEMDLSHLQPVNQVVLPVEEVPGRVSPVDADYVDMASLAGGDPAKPLPQAIKAKTRVKLVTAQLVAAAAQPSLGGLAATGLESTTRTWVLAAVRVVAMAG